MWRNSYLTTHNFRAFNFKFANYDKLNLAYIGALLLFIAQFFLELNPYSNLTTRGLSFSIFLVVLLFLKVNEKNDSILTKYISFLYFMLVMPRLLMMAYIPGMVNFPFDNVNVTQINSGLTLLLLSTLMLYLGMFIGVIIWPPKPLQQDKELISLKCVIIVFILMCAVEFYLNYFVGLSPYSLPRNTPAYNTIYQLLRATFAIDAAVFVNLILLLTSSERLKSRKWIIFVSLSVIIFLINAAISGSRGGSLRIFMEFITISMVVYKMSYLNRKLFVGFLLFIVISSVFSYSVGNASRNALVNDHKLKEDAVVGVLPELNKASGNFSVKDPSVFLSGVVTVINRLSIVDYAILLPFAIKNEQELESYINFKYIYKSTLNSILPGILYPEASLSTSRAINVIYRGYSTTYVLNNGYFSEFWTSFSLLFFLFGYVGLILHFAIGIILQYGYTRITKLESRHVLLILIYSLYLIPSFILFTMGIDHTIQTLLILYIQLISFFSIYRLLKRFI